MAEQTYTPRAEKVGAVPHPQYFTAQLQRLRNEYPNTSSLNQLTGVIRAEGLRTPRSTIAAWIEGTSIPKATWPFVVNALGNHYHVDPATFFVPVGNTIPHTPVPREGEWSNLLLEAIGRARTNVNELAVKLTEQYYYPCSRQKLSQWVRERIPNDGLVSVPLIADALGEPVTALVPVWGKVNG